MADSDDDNLNGDGLYHVNPTFDLDDGWWECSQCGAMSMHYDSHGQPECINCDEPFVYLPWRTIFWCCVFAAAVWGGIIWWIFYA